ncbi:restriction endonuclease subunit S [Denitrificimonas sp. JX-1]|uniref:Restriction endonuclease subunit S n=1 Tax=Denitrificimonas halotolerans TaxID=3098930 RepID=A0ABU5GS98_9GAMM|nr:restriction endonuclease subunit S [Denitrificimonas sp. JX-1]MDY7219862.1 restriction endonuclease subunit S [Denitrificimonas sp. JX-1]
MDELSHLPCDWQKINVSSVADVIDPHPSHRAPDEDPLGIPFAGIGDLDESGKIRGNKVRRVSPEIYEEHSKRYQITANTIGFGRVASIGKIIDFKGLPKKITISPTLALIEPNRIEKNFLIQALKSQDTQLQINLLLTGSTRSSLGIALLRNLIIPFPKLPEQQKIATILSSVDDVIEKTRAQIDKLKDLKTGMMQELLTKGIGHTEFKDSPVGQIPRSWDVVSVGSLTDVIDPQPDHRTPAEVIDGVPYVGLGDIGKSGLIDFSAARKVSQEAFEKQKEGFEIHPGAFIFGKIGTIGKPYVLPTERFYCLSANVVLVTTKKSINMKYLFQVFGSEIIDQQVLLQTNTTSQPALGIKKVRDFLVPYPKQCEEVELITEVLASVDNRISRVNDKLAHQLDLKKALMQDLLTGKVRVNLTDKESAVV